MSQAPIIQFLKDLDAAEAAVAALQRINIANTKTNRTIRELEDEFNRKISSLFNKILDDHKKSFLPFVALKGKYGNEVKALIRSGIQRVYQAGAEYSARVMKEKNVFLSRNNLDSISKMTDDTNDFFWRQVNQHIDSYDSQQMRDQLGFAITPERALTVAVSTALIFNAMSTVPLAIASMEKYNELVLAGGGGGLPDARIVYWTENDERVCPICAPLHGTEYDVGDPFIPIPVQDTHPRCRCRLLLKSGDEVYSM
jgi:hypothetical protein